MWRRELRGGRLVLTEPGAPVRVEPAREWGEPRTVDGFLLEVAGLVEELAGRTTAVLRCSDAIRRFCATPDDDGLGLLREAYLAIPAHRRTEAVAYADGPAVGVGAPVEVCEVVYPGGWPEGSGLFVLRNDYPAPVEYGGVVCPTVLHGYWALSAADPVDRAVIRGACDGRGVREAGGRAVRRADWAEVRLAVLAGRGESGRA